MVSPDSTDKWVTQRLQEFHDNPEECLHDLLIRLNNTAIQFLNSPKSDAALNGLENAVAYTGLFLNQIDK